MANDGIHIEYNAELEPLAGVLGGVKRPGDFVVQGSLELPMPKVEVEGVGVLSFPVPESQVAALIQQATRAPYGRGEETVVDTAVRKVWQLPADKVRIGGKSWAASFERIMEDVVRGLGCVRTAVSAELYKLLVYDRGGFFLAHRDTEKAGGMFGTLVAVLPCAHRGGELIVRHAGREVAVELSGGGVSEVAFAAFYADCEHEVRPVTEGSRVCLVFNLVQKTPSGTKRRAKTLGAPDYEPQIAQAAGLLEQALARREATTKIAWLLEHQYSAAGLSFAALKSADAGKAGVLVQAAARAGCAAHLALVHIEETGPAEPVYSGYKPRRGRYRDYDDDEEEDVEEDAGDDEFEVVEVSDSWQYADQWRDPEDRPVNFGSLPLADGELLPKGALDGTKPDSQRLMEATGNEGASFERSYHRAAVVIWRRERYAEVLLQAGVGAALPWLKECIAAGAGGGGAHADAVSLARRMIHAWKTEPEFFSYRHAAAPASRAEMLELLRRLGDASLLAQFIAGVVTPDYDGSENAALPGAARLLGEEKTGELFSGLLRGKMREFHGEIVDLFRDLVGKPATRAKRAPAGHAALREIGEAAVAALDTIEAQPASPANERGSSKYISGVMAFEVADDAGGDDWPRKKPRRPLDAAFVADLLDILGTIDADDAPGLRESAAQKIAARPEVFDPVTMVVPALGSLLSSRKKGAARDGALEHLWAQSAQFLLQRSELPPESPQDWRQEATLTCGCADCRELQAFARDPATREHRFRVRKERRQHLHRAIDGHALAMKHVTERAGSPQTLVCTKDRRNYRRRCEQYRQDVAALAALAGHAPRGAGKLEESLQRIEASRARYKQWSPSV